MAPRTLVLAALLTSALSLAAPEAIPLRQGERTTGLSGALKVAIADPGEVLSNELDVPEGARASLQYRWVQIGGAESTAFCALQSDFRAPQRPGAWRLEAQLGQQPVPTELVVLVPVPASAIRDGHLNGYYIGRYPAAGRGLAGRYAPPERFIEVTEQTQDLPVSEHFRIRDFLTHDQEAVWPKYLVLELRLVDKLELVTQQLHQLGFAQAHLHVMSGFRTPQYNGPGGKDGRARFSRHTYGDAGDVWAEGDAAAGYMEDLNGDGKRDVRDAEVLASAVERVEQKYPELVGGEGVYPANGAHGPFVHVDVRGRAARWAKE